MSRLGKQPIELPNGVEFKHEGNVVTVKGSKEQLKLELKKPIKIIQDGKKLILSTENVVTCPGKFLGLYRSLIANMVIGVTTGFKKDLELKGVGYRASIQGNKISLSLGFSHPTEIDIPKGLSVTVDKNVSITITGADKQLVGQFAATIHHLRKPEPYKAKGVHYLGQFVRRKAGKSAAKK
jgi:large subunit ribosomal protein L6